MTSSNKIPARLAAGVISVLLCSLGGTSQAAQESSQARSLVRLDIPAGALAAVLGRFADVSGVQLVYDSDLTRGLESSGLKGAFSPEDALVRLLAGTGLRARMLSATSATLEKLTDAEARMLGPVRVEGVESARTTGVNGSTDLTATEGTGSYTSSAMSIGSKTPQSMKDTPQSMSVITQQRMLDQNLTDFTSMMNQATGVTLVTGGTDGTASNLEPVFYSRGFAINTIQIDGGGPLSTNPSHGYYPQIDMAMYDHVEILRGADGLFNGYGNPSGSVNLARKRPLAHEQMVVEGRVGSWNNYRAVLDATAPLAVDGRLRGRAVMSYQDQDYFYDTASNAHTLVYGVAEADVTSSTIARVGISFTRQDAVPWRYGLSRYENGDDLKLSRGTCLCASWSRWNIETKEIFAQVDQHFSDDWSLKFNLTRSDQESRHKSGYVYGPVNAITQAGPKLRASMSDNASAQMLADFTLNGAFELFGQRQEIVLGGNYQDVNAGGAKMYPSPIASADRPAVNVFAFDPFAPAYREPASPQASMQYPEFGQKQWGLYTTLRFTPIEPVHFITGTRYSHYDSFAHSQSLDPDSGEAIPGSDGRSSWNGDDFSWPPMYSLVYDLSESLVAYASYADIYVSQASQIDHSGRPLKPIVGSNVEVGLKLETADGRLNATVSAYRIEQKNTAIWVDYGDYEDVGGDVGNGTSCCYRHSNGVYFSRGVDAEVTGEVLPGWQVFAGYTWNVNRIEGSDSYSPDYEGPKVPLVSRAPKHLFKLWTSYRFQAGEILRRLSIGGGVNAQTESYQSGSACTAYEYQLDANGNEIPICTATAPYDYTQGSYAVFSLQASYDLDSKWNLALNVNNLTDRTYYQTVGSSDYGNWYGEPRGYMLTLRGNF